MSTGSSLLDKVSDQNVLYDFAVLIITGSLIAFALEVAEFLVVWHTSSLTFAVSGIVKVNNDPLTIVVYFQ